MSEHAKLAPSAAHRWMTCPGSIELCDGIPDPESIYAAEGTFAHAVAAECLELNLDAEDKLDTQSHCGRFQVDEKMARHINTYLRAVRGTLELEGGTLQIEAKVVVIKDVLWGTADALVWNPPDLHIFDLKYGAGVFVPADDNFQALIYALGALRTPHLNGAPEIRNVHLHIVQPRHFGDGRKWRTHSLERRGLETWFKLSVEPRVDEVDSPDAKLVAGDHCRFCPAKAICPELRRTALAHTKHLFEDAEQTQPVKPPPNPKTLTVAQVSTAMKTFPLVEEWMKAVRQHAYELAEKERIAIPGFKLVRKSGHRRWHDEKRAAGALKKLGIEPFDRKIVSPAEAERRLGPDKDVVSTLAYVPDIGTALVPESDRRPAWVPGEAFSQLTEDEESEKHGS